MSLVLQQFSQIPALTAYQKAYQQAAALRYAKMLYSVIFLLLSAVIAWKVNEILPYAFIDEIFHISQTQQYCNGSYYKWDSKITTPPGLYIFALLINLPLKIWSSGYFCSIGMLRAVNVLFNTANMFLLQRIIFEIRGKSTKMTALDKLQGFTLALFPLTYFFSFLFYTDPGSTMLVLAAYLANLQSKHKISAFLGLLAVFFRQTNIVWVFFLAGSVVVKEMVKTDNIKEIETSPEIEDKLARFLVSIVAAAVKYLLVIGNIIDIIKQIWPYLSVIAMFIGFLYKNGGIVLGDRENHVAMFHAVQIQYFLAFALFFSFPHLMSLSYLHKFVKAVKRNPLKFLSISLAFGYFAMKYTYIHNFLLADNRHYTFYLCRYFLNYRLARILVLPLYVYGGWSINEALEKPKCSGIWKLLFLVCTVLVTVPQRLIELRYFILPYLLLRVNLPVKNFQYVVFELLLYIFVNVVTLYVFFTKSVIWSDLDTVQRIIW